MTRELRPVDARHLPEELDGVRTLFDGFHHFAPSDARALLRDASERKIPIVIAEGVERSFMCAPDAVSHPLRPARYAAREAVLVDAPFLTYLVPLVPLFVLFDGLVSCMRAYTERELHDLAKVRRRLRLGVRRLQQRPRSSDGLHRSTEVTAENAIARRLTRPAALEPATASEKRWPGVVSAPASPALAVLDGAVRGRRVEVARQA